MNKVMLLAVAGVLAVNIGIGYIVIHFVAKFW